MNRDRAPKYYDVPRTASVGECSEPTCRKPIYWIASPNTGKPMPIDCAADAECRAPFMAEDGRGISHFFTCTNPNRFSGRADAATQGKA